MNYASLKLEFSPDALSDTTPSWVPVSQYCQSASWSSGKVKDLDQPQAGGATFVLKNTDRRFEPEYVAGAYYPNIRPMRRFRLSIISGGVTTQQGIYYATSWAVSYPAGTDYSVVTVTCVDGFGVLSNEREPALNPAAAASVGDVQAFDEPFAQFTLSDVNSTKMAAATGTDGVYKNGVLLGSPSLVPGDNGTAVIFGPGNSCGRSVLSDTNQFSDGNSFTVEAVADLSSAPAQRLIVAGPWNGSVHTFTLTPVSITYTDAGGGVTALAISPSAAIHHLAAVWNGNALIGYVDGAEVGRTTAGLSSLDAGNANEYLYVGGSTHQSTSDTFPIQYAAFYEQALSRARIQAHADAALNRGRAAETVGVRVAALAANPLWGTSHIPASQLTAMPRMFTGQSTLDEITTTVAAEQPIGMFYFRDDGDPAYYSWDDTRLITPSAIFGDAPGEIHYTTIDLQYDDVLYNDVVSGRDGGDSFEVVDSSSQAEFGSGTSRTLDATGLILNTDTDAQYVGTTLLNKFSQPAYTIDSITLNGATTGALTQILTREIGDTIRVRRRGTGGTPIDIITQILGKSKSFDPNGNLVCTWNLAMGFNAATSTWRLGVNGYDELGSTAVLG